MAEEAPEERREEPPRPAKQRPPEYRTGCKTRRSS
jgi:hypothetical protein